MAIFKVILKSVCCGIAALVAAMFVLGLAVVLFGIYFGLKSAPPVGGGEVGWDVVSMVHNLPVNWKVFPLLGFAFGFFYGFRYFSKSLALK
ncbi:MAG: hypothetical protein WCA15_03250 [Candidatus Acidiferrales bacterium]